MTPFSHLNKTETCQLEGFSLRKHDHVCLQEQIFKFPEVHLSGITVVLHELVTEVTKTDHLSWAYDFNTTVSWLLSVLISVFALEVNSFVFHISL